jgi:golgi phosphoprotein 3
MELSITERFLVIAHQPEKGGFIISQIFLEYGLAGAILLEMSLQDIVSVEDDMLILKKNAKPGSQIISDISSMISRSEKPRKADYWIRKIAEKSRTFRWTVLEELADKRVISIENKKFLGLIPYRRSYLADRDIRYTMIQHLKNNILFHKELSNETVSVLGLIEACKMHKIITDDRDELKAVKKELKIIIKESPIAEKIDKTIKQVQAAVIAAVVASTAAASARGHS